MVLKQLETNKFDLHFTQFPSKLPNGLMTQCKNCHYIVQIQKENRYIYPWLGQGREKKTRLQKKNRPNHNIEMLSAK